MIEYEGSKSWDGYDAIKRVINSVYGIDTHPAATRFKDYKDYKDYIDTDIAATKEAFKNFILEGNKMQFKRGAYELACFSSAPITNKYNVKKIIHSGLWTIVTWEDGTLTKVKMEDDGHYDEYAAFTAALAKKVYGNNSKVHKILEKKTKRDLKDRIKNAKTVDLFPDIPEEKKKASREAAIKRRDGEL